MNCVPAAGPAGFPGPLASRRSLLRGGALLGLSAAAAACAPLTQPPGGSPASAAQAGTTAGQPPRTGRLDIDYRPSQPTGWSPPYTPALGGHVGSTDLTWHGQAYRVSLLPIGQTGHAPNPV